jgi:hypothetical protein
MSVPKRLQLATALAAWLFSCACVGESYRQRVEAPLQGESPTIVVGCMRVQALPETQAAADGAPLLMLRSPEDAPGFGVGEFSRWPGATPIPLYVRGPTPHEALRRDAGTLLSRSGCALAGAGSAAGLVLDLELFVFRVEPTSARWYQLKGSLDSQVGFEASLRRGEELLWQQRFEGAAHKEVVYFLASDSEELLNEAYCQALAAFELALATPAFRSALPR